MHRLLSMFLALVMSGSVFTAPMQSNRDTADDSTSIIEPTTPPELPEDAVFYIPDGTPHTKNITINGTDISEYVIVTNASAGGVMSYAATELQEYIETTCGVKLEILESAPSAGTKRILIDETRITDNSSFGVYTDKDGLVLAGTAKRSALYSVYHFLEEFLGWRFLADDCEGYYGLESIDLSNINYTKVLQMQIRDVYDLTAFDKDFSVKRYFNGDGKRRMSADTHLGGEETRCPNGVHTFDALAETGGDGGSGGTQPCLNDAKVRETMLKNVRAFLDANPNVLSIHVSQNDNNRYCTCAECTADLELYGAPSGSIIELCNYICEDLETYKDGAYKDVMVITFAYQYSIDAPKNITLHDNIMIELAIIDFCHQHAFENDDCAVTESFLRNNQEIVPQIEAWTKICDNFYIWDYGIDFKHFWIPYPNLDVLYDNVKYLMEIGAWGYILQCNCYTDSAEFGALRSYIYAKMTDNPDMTREEYDALIVEFMKAYYGDAWEYMMKYFDLCHELSNKADTCFGCFSAIDNIYGEGGVKAFAPYFDELVEWFDTAEALVADDETTLKHVRMLRISMDFMRIGAKYRDVKKTKDQELIQALYDETEEFYKECNELGLNRPTEAAWVLPADQNGKLNPLSIG